MRRKTILLLGALFSLFSASYAQTSDTRPNVIFILVDDLGYGDLSVQGAKDLLTPNIDEIAQKGIILSQFYANCTVCSPSRASLLTGKYPDMAGVPGVIRQFKDNSWGNLSDSVAFISEVFQKNGYHTGMVGKWHLGFEDPDIPTARGFDLFKGFLGDMMDDYWTHLRGGVNWMRFNEKIIDPEGHATDIFTRWAIEYMKERAEEKKPFFLYLAYNAPHFPIQPPQKWLDRLNEREPGLTKKKAENVAFIEHLDYNIGRILETMEETGSDSNTLLVFTSDNGGALRYEQSNGDLRGGKQDMYEGGIRVPAFVYWKDRIKPGSRSDNMALLMDFFPTLCEAAGINTPSGIDGISILPTLLGESQTTDNRYVFWVRREGGTYGGQAYYTARYKDIKILQNTPYEDIQVFNIKEDRHETTPLDPSKTESYDKIRYQLQLHIQKAGAVPWQ